METKANYVAVGIFTLLAVLAAFGFVYWTAGWGDQAETATLRVRIPGSASGLGRGSAVLFNGVKVGDVQRVYIDVKDPGIAIADTVVDINTPITKSTGAVIGLAGLTGQANIEIKGTNTGEPNLLHEAEENGTVAEIIADPSAVTNLLQTAQDIFKRADAVLGELEGFVREARGPLTETVGNVKEFSDALGRNAEGIDKFLANFATLSDSLAGVSGQLDSTLKAAEGLLNAVDRDKVASIVENFETFTQTLETATSNLDTIMAGVDTAVTSINTFARDADATLGKVDTIVSGIDPDTVRNTLSNFESASAGAKDVVETARVAAADITKATSTIGERAEDIDQIITDARLLSGRLAQASVRIDGVLAKVDTLLGSGEAEGLMADASETLKAFREVADTLNARMGAITDGLARFTGQGLRDVEALVRDSRRSITRIEQAITDLERNPQRIITGGDGAVRQYDGRARR